MELLVRAGNRADLIFIVDLIAVSKVVINEATTNMMEGWLTQVSQSLRETPGLWGDCY